MAAAFRFNNATSPAAAGTNDAWKAQGFLNLYLPGAEGKQTKLGAIPLRQGNADEAALLAWLKKDPANALELLRHLTIDFREVKTDGARFAIPGMGK